MWAGHVERMADDRPPKRAAELREQGRRRRGRPRLQWEDCVKRDVRRAGGDEGGQGWDGRTVLREMWGRQERRKTGKRRQETEEGGKYYQMRRWKVAGSSSPLTKGNEEERDVDNIWRGICEHLIMCARVRACVCACVRVCVRAYVRACVCQAALSIV